MCSNNWWDERAQCITNSKSYTQTLTFRSVLAQNSTAELRKTCTHSIPSLSSLPKLALRTVPILVRVDTDQSQTLRKEHSPFPFSAPLSFWWSLLVTLSALMQQVPQAPQHLYPANLYSAKLYVSQSIVKIFTLCQLQSQMFTLRVVAWLSLGTLLDLLNINTVLLWGLI